MSVAIYGEPVRHRAAASEADPRILVTVCGIRFHPDPSGYRRAMRVTGATPPRGRCAACGVAK